MQVTLYKYTGEQDVANKILQNATEVYNQDVTPYGAFDPNGAIFRLSELYDVNYGKFTFNNHDYYGYVDISVDSKGLYNYRITTDALTTAWYADCFNTNNLCIYSNYGNNNNLQDQRISYSNGSIIESIGNFTNSEYDSATNAYKGEYVAMVILNPEHNVATDPSQYTQSPAFDVYLMRDWVYELFIQKFHALSDKDQNRFNQCIIKLYIIDSKDGYSLTHNLTATRVITLFSVNSTTGEDVVYTDIDVGEGANYIYNISKAQNFVIETITGLSTSFLFENINATNYQDSILLSIKNCGLINIKATDLSKTFENIQTSPTTFDLAYIRYYDFVGGQQAIIPQIRYPALGVFAFLPLMQYRVNIPLPETFPFMYDSSITNWTSVVASSVLGIISTVGNVAVQNYVAATSSLIGTGATLAKNISEAKYGPASITGSTGGSLSRVINSGEEKIYFIHKEIVNLIDYQSKYGKPDGKMRNISQLSGWVQSNPCHLISNGLPNDIITAAEQSANNGFEII